MPKESHTTRISWQKLNIKSEQNIKINQNTKTNQYSDNPINNHGCLANPISFKWAHQKLDEKLKIITKH